MDLSQNKILIIGGGLSGLTTAYLAQQKNKTVTVLEAADRLGGRIHTISGIGQTPMDLGATWLSDQHPALITLIKELGLRKFPQYDTGITLFQTKSFEPPQGFHIPESTVPSYRITGGTSVLIQALAERLATEQVILNATVQQIRKSKNGIQAILAGGQVFEGDQAIICLPPQVAAANIDFTPAFSGTVNQLLSEVQTWMAGSIKFTVEYSDPFWRKDGYSGMLFSHSGVITEMYDHTNFEGNKFSLTGFLNGGVQHYAPTIRKQYVLEQLTTLFGEKAGSPTTYYDKTWNDPTLLAGKQVFTSAHYNNGHPQLQKTYMNGKLLFAGSETSSTHPGYMEGAVTAAQRAVSQL